MTQLLRGLRLVVARFVPPVLVRLLVLRPLVEREEVERDDAPREVVPRLLVERDEVERPVLVREPLAAFANCFWAWSNSFCSALASLPLSRRALETNECRSP